MALAAMTQAMATAEGNASYAKALRTEVRVAVTSVVSQRIVSTKTS